MINNTLFSLGFGQSPLLFISGIKIPFDLIYLITIILGVIAFMAVGVAKKYPLGTWTTIVTIVSVFFITGLVLFSYPINSWFDIFTENYQQVQYIKYVPGGILFATIGLFAIKKMLRFVPSVGDSFIIFLPVMAILQRIGCLMNGCCYGKPTILPWAVQYPETSPVYQTQLNSGVINLTDHFSNGVHPTQLYMILGYMVVFAMLLITGKSFKIPGTRTLFGISLLAVVRFVVEFWREPNLNAWYSASWLGLSFLQWSIVVFALICSVMIYLKIYKNDWTKVPVVPVIEKPFLNFIIIFALFVIIWQIREIFDSFELLLLAGIFSVPIVVNTVRIFQKLTLPSLRWLSLGMMIVAFFAMSQQIIESPKDSLAAFKKSDWFGVGINVGAGTYHEITRDCNGHVTGVYDRNFLVSGGDFSYHLIPKPNQKLTAGVNIFYQEDIIKDKSYFDVYSGTIFNPHVLYDFKHVGVGTGLLYSSNTFSALGENHILPSGYLRLGRRDKLYTEFSMMQNFYKNGALGTFQMGLGGGFGHLDKNSLRVGLGFFPNSRTALYLDGSFLISGCVYLKPGFAIGDDFNGSIGLQVLLGKDRKKR